MEKIDWFSHCFPLDLYEQNQLVIKECYFSSTIFKQDQDGFIWRWSRTRAWRRRRRSGTEVCLHTVQAKVFPVWRSPGESMQNHRRLGLRVMSLINLQQFGQWHLVNQSKHGQFSAIASKYGHGLSGMMIIWLWSIHIQDGLRASERMILFIAKKKHQHQDQKKKKKKTGKAVIFPSRVWMFRPVGRSVGLVGRSAGLAKSGHIIHHHHCSRTTWMDYYDSDDDDDRLRIPPRTSKTATAICIRALWLWLVEGKEGG